MKTIIYCSGLGFCPGVRVRVHKGITIALSLFRSHWLAVAYCLVLCSGSCEPVHGTKPLIVNDCTGVCASFLVRTHNSNSNSTSLLVTATQVFVRRFLPRLSPDYRTGEGELQFVHSSEVNMKKLTYVE